MYARIRSTTPELGSSITRGVVSMGTYVHVWTLSIHMINGCMGNGETAARWSVRYLPNCTVISVGNGIVLVRNNRINEGEWGEAEFVDCCKAQPSSAVLSMLIATYLLSLWSCLLPWIHLCSYACMQVAPFSRKSIFSLTFSIYSPFSASTSARPSSLPQ